MVIAHKAMEYLEENDFEYEEINIDLILEAKEFLKQVGIQLVPTTYTVGILVQGGCSGLLALIQRTNSKSNT